LLPDGEPLADGYDNERPAHEVCVDDFFMGRYEVAAGQFLQFVTETGYQTEAEKGEGSDCLVGCEWQKGKDITWRNPGFFQTEHHPVVCVSYEAEWEYAARGGGKNHRYSWGNELPASGNIADESFRGVLPHCRWSIWERYSDGFAFTALVGSYSPNEIGLL